MADPFHLGPHFMRAVVLGIGNTILTDEAAGVRAVEALELAFKTCPTSIS
jgi:Ni,Fe-hydrogenase maturation factor